VKAKYPYAHCGNGWENYEEPVVNAIPERLMSEGMDRDKRLRFRVRLGGQDFPWTVDGHKLQTVMELKTALLQEQFGGIPIAHRPLKKFCVRLFSLKNHSDSGRDRDLDVLTLQEIGIRTGDFIMFGLVFNENADIETLK
jgi:hypothetical protein